MDFRNRHVIVTGGAGALGTAVVARLIEAGAVCHVPCLNEAEAARFRLRDHKQVTVTVTGSLADETAIEKLYRGVTPLWASIHTVGGFAASALRDTDLATIRQQLEMNLISCILCCRAAVRAMTGSGGRIVNVAARPALEWRTGAGMTAYTASKAGVAALTVALAEEVAKAGILVNAVAPSIMDTPANRQAMPKADYGLWPKVEEVAATIAFLISPENLVTRGAIVPVYGRSQQVRVTRSSPRRPDPAEIIWIPAYAGTSGSRAEPLNTPPTGRVLPVRAGGRPDRGNKCCRRRAANGCGLRWRRRPR
jgi:NAD(P)-dependent dehydrogenase (short-subunit alcohol dehydrogenase family)